MSEPKIVRRSPNQSLLAVLAECIRVDATIDEATRRCNEWQRERMKAEKEVFGAPITRELTENEVRNAMVYLRELNKKRRKND